MPVTKLTKRAIHSGSGKGEFSDLPETSEAATVTQIDTEIIATGKKQSGRGKRKREDDKLSAEAVKEDVIKTAKRRANIKVEKVGIKGNNPTQVSPKKTKDSTKVKVEQEENVSTSEPPADSNQPPIKTKKKTSVKHEKKDLDGEDISKVIEEEGATPKKTKRKRKTKEEKEAEAMPIAARTAGLRMFVGAHVSGAKGVHNSIKNCLHIGGNALALFLKSQRQWRNPPLQDDHRDQFKALCLEHNYDAASHILPHGSYFVNLAQEDPEKATQAYNAFIEDLRRCEALGIKLYNFHPGSTGPTATRPSAISRIANALNRALSSTKTVTPVLETMAGAGGVIGNTFEDLAGIIAEVDDKSRIGVCLDTCHVFAAGYDLREPEQFRSVMKNFDDVVGLKYLKALHLNDSKAPFNSHRDLHANIGTGFLGLRAFHNIMNETRFENLPMVLETPIDKTDPNDKRKTIEDKAIWAREIKTLEELIGMNTESENFRRKEKELSAIGKEERTKHWEQYERKLEKDAKAAAKGGKKSKKESGKGNQTTLAFGTAKAANGKKESVSESDDLSSAPESSVS